MKNPMLKCIVVLGSICLAVAVLLGAVNYVTAPIIEENARREAEKAFLRVLPDATELETVALTDDVPDTVVEIRRDKGGSGYAFMVKSAGRGGSVSPITSIVGIDANGKIIAVVVSDVSGESPGYGEKIQDKEYLSQFKGKDSLLSGVGTISGATISSEGLLDGVKDAFTAFLAVAEFEETDEQKLARLIYTVIDGMTDKNSYPLQVSGSSVISALRDENGYGYAVALRDGDRTVIAGVSPFGELLKLIDLDGNDLTASAAASVTSAANAAVASDLARIRGRHAEDIRVLLLSDGATLSPLPAKVGLPASVIDAYAVSDSSDGAYAFILSIDGVRVAAVASADGAIVSSAVLSIGGDASGLPLADTVLDAVNLYKEVSGQ